MSPVTHIRTDSALCASPFSCIGLRLRPSKLFGIADGLSYLHSHNVVHGDLKGVSNFSKTHLTIVLTSGQPNILVDDSGCPRITDFGLVVVAQNQDSIWDTRGDPRQTVRWTAPEILSKKRTFSEEADVFSFAMVMVEVRCRYSPWLDRWPTSSP